MSIFNEQGHGVPRAISPAERQTLKEQLQNRKLKLEAKKRHLKNLYDKKVRIENEIRGTMKSLKRDLAKDRKVLRENLALEEDASPLRVQSGLLYLADSDQEFEVLLDEISQIQSELVQYATPEPEYLTAEELKTIKSF
jgi:hypothetical protein